MKGARATAVIALMRESGALRFDDDGKPELVVKRSRSKGAAAEELAFDLSAGVDDWAKTPDAAEFLPAPTKTQSGAPPSQQNGRRAPQKYAAPPVTDAEAVRRTAEQLESQGVNVNAILNE